MDRIEAGVWVVGCSLSSTERSNTVVFPVLDVCMAFGGSEQG